MKNPWIEHLSKVKKEHPELLYRERVKLAQETYKKKGEEETKDYIPREEFEKHRKSETISYIFLTGMAFIIPVLYSVTANTGNYFTFYLMCFIGFFCVGYSSVKYIQWRKRYGKKVGMEKNSISRD